jgi:hypothetical protein
MRRSCRWGPCGRQSRRGGGVMRDATRPPAVAVLGRLGFSQIWTYHGSRRGHDEVGALAGVTGVVP